MSEAEFSIPSRQKSDDLFGSEVALLSGQSFVSGVRRVSGYAQVTIFAVSDSAFTIVVEEAAVVAEDGTGNFAQTQTTLTSTTVAGNEQIVTRITPFANFMKMTLSNPGPGNQSFLSFLAQGLPVS